MVRYEGLEVVDAEWCLCKGGKRLFSGIKRLGNCAMWGYSFMARDAVINIFVEKKFEIPEIVQTFSS